MTIPQTAEAAAMDVHLYLDSVYYGFFPISKIESHFAEYEHNAELYRDILDWDEVLLYAILAYDDSSETMLSAEFMLMRIPYDRFVRLRSSISENCRLFFKISPSAGGSGLK